MFSIRDLKNNVLIGCCGLVYINWKDRHADLSLYIGKNDLYIDDNGWGNTSPSAFSNISSNELNFSATTNVLIRTSTNKKIILLIIIICLFLIFNLFGI